MTMEEKMSGSDGEDGGTDRFPIGMRVLAVDDDPICLKILETLLRQCEYHVTTTNQSITALKMLRENRNKYELVVSDVNMPDMDGFKLLELVGLEMDLPVIMLSAHSDTKLVMKGITHGACDYLLKPVRIEELRNIWQHVLRRKKPASKDHDDTPNPDKARGGTGEFDPTSRSSSDQEVNKKRKDQSEEEDEDAEDSLHENEDSSTQKKPRFVWSVELHGEFVAAVNQLGFDKAVPKKILDIMNVEGLTREKVASHLQKYRLFLKKLSSEASYSRMCSLNGFGDLRTLTGPRRVPSASLPSYQPDGMFGRLNSSAALGLRGISSGMISNNLINGLGTVQPATLPANQNQNGIPIQGIPTSIQHNKLSQNRSADHSGEFDRVNDPNVFGVATNIQGSSSSTLPTSSGNPFLLQTNTQQTTHDGPFGNQLFLGVTSLSQEPFDMHLPGSFDLLDHGRCSENWLGVVQSSSFPSNSMFANEASNHEQLSCNNLQESICWNSSLDLSPPMANSTSLEDSRGDFCQVGLSNNNVIQNIGYTTEQQWG